MHSTPALPTPNDRLRLAYRLFLFMRLLYTFTSHQQHHIRQLRQRICNFRQRVSILNCYQDDLFALFCLLLKGTVIVAGGGRHVVSIGLIWSWLKKHCMVVSLKEHSE